MQPANDGQTPLHIAVASEVPNIVDILAANAAEILEDDEGSTPLDLAINAGLQDITESLSTLAASLPVFKAATAGDCSDLATALAAANDASLDYSIPDPSVSDGNFLHRLAQDGFDSCIAPVMDGLAEDADREAVIFFTNNLGQLPSDVAAYYGQTEAFKAILAVVADSGLVASDIIEHQDNDGRTPFILAAEGGHVDMINYLGDEGANVNHVSASVHFSLKAYMGKIWKGL